ncbi:carbohydrate esterase family 16 protein [Hortaea werneckii]|nr:carbohydrate esterase family 16 protein [Hortaea werneckii]
MSRSFKPSLAVIALLSAAAEGIGPSTITETKEIHKTHWRTRWHTHTHTHTQTLSTDCPSPATNTRVPSSSPAPEIHWPGWSGISRMFAFGDSYSTTGFNLSLTQPSESNPLGNPEYPGYTATNGPNWVDFLTVTYNRTLLETVNLAYGGATVDSELIAPYKPTVLSMKDQILDEFVPMYAGSPDFFEWQANNTLFAIWIGINDVGNAYTQANSSLVYPLVMTEYTSLLDTLYQHGARNFLFINVPPVNRSPLTLSAGAEAEATEATDIAVWNANVTHMATNLSTVYPDATTFVFDSNTLFYEVLQEPCAYAETCPYRNTTEYCESYMNGTPEWDTFYPNCSIPVDEYFWLNSLHPTFRMMNITAQEIARQLS